MSLHVETMDKYFLTWIPSSKDVYYMHINYVISYLKWYTKTIAKSVLLAIVVTTNRTISL
jgi:hypothetical protein